MKNLTLSIKEVEQFGFLGASLLDIIRVKKCKTADQMVELLPFESARGVHNELTRLHKQNAISYERTKSGARMAFLIGDNNV